MSSGDSMFTMKLSSVSNVAKGSLIQPADDTLSSVAISVLRTSCLKSRNDEVTMLKCDQHDVDDH